MNSRIIINQLLHTLSYGDAISGEALAIKTYFDSQGIKSDIYAINIDPRYKSIAKYYTELNPEVFDEKSGHSIILHYSLGSPLNDLYKAFRNTKKYLIYHNLTPYKWFEGVNPKIVSDIKDGIKELPGLCGISDFILADSEFNAKEIQKLGFNPEVLELPLDPRRWEVETNSGIDSILKTNGKFNFMHVGRLAPNKCIEDILKAFYFLHHKINKNTHLWLAGIDIDTEIYAFSLKRLMYELMLSEAVSFVGRFADSELKALYMNADAYMCMSEHEGFCMPVIEAMYFNVPVIAYNSSALPYTMKNAGILLNNKNHPLIAEVMNKVVTDSILKNELKTSGQERVRELSYEIFSGNLNRLFIDKTRTVRAAGMQETYHV